MEILWKGRVSHSFGRITMPLTRNSRNTSLYFVIILNKEHLWRYFCKQCEHLESQVEVLKSYRFYQTLIKINVKTKIFLFIFRPWFNQQIYISKLYTTVTQVKNLPVGKTTNCHHFCSSCQLSKLMPTSTSLFFLFVLLWSILKVNLQSCSNILRIFYGWAYFHFTTCKTMCDY